MVLCTASCLQAAAQNIPVVTPASLDSTRQLPGHPVKRLNAAYLTLWYRTDVKDIEWLYNEIVVPPGEDPHHTYYSAYSGDGFYGGIQVNSGKERRVIFSVWDDKYGHNNRNEAAEGDRATLLKNGEGVVYNRFGGEGSGMHTHWVYAWKAGDTCKFLYHAVPDSAKNQTVISMFFYVDHHWKMIAKISRPGLQYLRGMGSFLEDFSGSDQHRRTGYFNNQWLRSAGGKWEELLKVTTDLPFGDKNRSVKDYGFAYSPDKGFMMSSGGGRSDYYLPPNTNIIREATGTPPLSVMPVEE